MKISLTFSFPIEFERITNGERVIVDAGPAESIVELLDGDIKGEDPLQQVMELLGQAEKEMRELKRRNR